MSKPIITELNVTELEKLQATMGNSILIIKFGAEWCGPCKKIAPTYKKFISKSANNIICADIDVDNSIDLYISFKKYKMVQSIPVFLVFYGDVKRDKWYIPDDSVVGSDEKSVAEFFKRCEDKANSLMPYTYYS